MLEYSCVVIIQVYDVTQSLSDLTIPGVMCPGFPPKLIPPDISLEEHLRDICLFADDAVIGRSGLN